MNLFEWDEAKNRSNRQKHGITFEEASEIFKGETFSRTDYREDHGEHRKITIGAIQALVVLVVIHTNHTYRTQWTDEDHICS